MDQRADRASDFLLVAVLFTVTLGPARVLPGGPGPLLLQAGLVLPLLWRRRAPVAVFAAISAVAFAQWLAAIQLPADAALLIALGTVAARRSRRTTLLAGAVLETGILLASARWAPDGRFVASTVALTAMAVAAAYLGVDRKSRTERALRRERDRITGETHDIVTHGLSAMVALADAASYGPPERTNAVLRQIADTGRHALADMRGSLDVLRADGPGMAELESLVGRARSAGLPTHLSLDGNTSAVPAAAQFTVYRLVQEALTNILKHAPPGTRAEVRVRIAPESVAVDVTDDGRASAAVPAGHGITGMHARAAAHGGRVQAGPLPGGGWRVSAWLGLR